MGLNLSNRLSAITQDEAGVTHVVWVEGTNIWHADYDPISQTWKNAQAIVNTTGQHIRSLNLIADSGLIAESGTSGKTTALIPGLAVIYQEGRDNDSDFFYTAALYNSSGKLQWLETPQALTADQVGDLEPRAVVDNGLITVVGQKVDLIKSQNQAIREDTDLYYQTFQINNNQFSTTTPTPVTPIAAYKPQIAKNGVMQGNYIGSGVTAVTPLAQANYRPFTRAEAQSAFQGFGANWSVSQTFDTNLSNLQFLKGMPDVPQFLLNPLFKKFNLAGTLLGSSGNNPNLSFFGGGVSTEGLLLNASMTVQEGEGDSGAEGSGSSGASLNPAQNTTNLTYKPETSISAIAATLYTFDQSLGENNLSYPLTVETGSLGVTFGFTFPLPIEGTPFLFDLLGSAGLGMQWQLSPKDPQTYISPVGAALSPTGAGSDTVLAVLFNVPPLGAVAAIGLAAISDITEIAELIFSEFDPDSNEAIELESLLFTLPIAAGIDGGIKIPFVFEALMGIQVSLAGTLGGTRASNNAPFQLDRDISLGFPMNITIKAFGFLGGTVGLYPYFTWGDDPSSTNSATLDQASLTATQASSTPTATAQGSLLTIQGLSSSGTLNPSDFQVTVADPSGATTIIPVFGVLTQGNATILRLESAIPPTTLNDQSFSNVTVTYQNNTPIPVINQSANTFAYNYNPISGTSSDYQVPGQQIIIAFNATLDPKNTPDLSRFQVTDANGNSISIQSIHVTPRNVLLTLSGNPSSTYTVNYNSSGTGNLLTTVDGISVSNFSVASNATPSTAGQVNRTYSNVPATTDNIITTNPLLGSTITQDFAEDSPPTLAVTDNGVLLAWSSDTPPITPISALLSETKSGTQIILTFADTLNNQSSNLPSISQFQVLINNQITTIQNLSATGNYVAITLSSSTVISADDTISVIYNIDSTLANSQNNLSLTDATEFVFWVPDFTTSVTQAASPTNTPALLESVAISNVLTLIFDQPLISGNSPAPSQFNVTVNNANTNIPVNNVGIENNAVILTLAEPVGQGDIITVNYRLGGGTLTNSNGISISEFTTSDILTTATNPGTVIKSLIATPSTSSAGIAYQTSILGTNGLNYDPVAYFNSATNQAFAAWINVDSSSILNQSIPGQDYSSSEIINQALQSSNIYFSIADLDNLGSRSPSIPWSVAAPIANQAGQDTNVTLGLGPNNQIMAAWLNTQLDNGNSTTTIYYSTLDLSSSDTSPAWSSPIALPLGINPDPFTPLTISTIDKNPAIFWTESAPASYRQLVLNAAPSVYLRLGESSGTVARNIGQFQATANGTYSGNFTLRESGALETANNTGDPNPAVLFQGGDVTLNQSVPLTDQAFAIEFWFKLPNLPKESINLVSAPGLFGLGLEIDANEPLLTFSLENETESQNATQIQASQTLASDVWYYVVGTYDDSSQNLSLYLNGVLAGTVEDVEFNSFPTSAALTLAGASTENNPVYLDEVAFYPKALNSSSVNATDLTSGNFQNLTGSQILEIIAGTNQIGNHYAAQYNRPIAPGPNTYYSVWDATTNNWQLPSQITPTPAIIPTQLADAKIPVFDLVSATASNTNTTIAPNGIADAVYQIKLSGQQNQTITGISVTSGNLAWAIGTDNAGKPLTGNQANQLGVLLGDTLLNSLNPETSTFSYPIQGNTEDFFLFVDLGSNTTPTSANITVYFQNNNNILTLNNISPYLIDAAAMEPDQTVTGTATVTEANDASLALIDSGFIINSDNPAIGYVLASAFNTDGSLAYVAVGNRGYSNPNDPSSDVNGTVQILFSGSEILSGNGSLSTTNLDGNPNGVLITNIQDAGDNQRNLSLSLATGDIDGDGIPDLIIGAPNIDDFAGAVYVIYGSYLNSQKGQTIDVTNLTTTSNSTGFVINGSEAEDLAGFSVVVGNFDGDAYDDIVFGAPYAKNSAGNRVGLVYKVAGFAQGNAPGSISPSVIYPGKSFTIPNPTPNPTSPPPNIIVGEGAGFALGVSRRLTNGPSTFTGSTTTDDLFIGAPNYQINVTNQWTNQSNLPGQNSSNSSSLPSSSAFYPSSSWISAGAAYVFNTNNGLSSTTAPWATYTGPVIPNAQGTATNYFAGTVIGSGLNTDLDGDGRQDLVIAGPGANTNTGQAYVISGAGATQSESTSQALNTASNLVINGGLDGGKAGTVVTSPGDLNNDGYQDFLITAPQGANATGQSYVVFGSQTIFNQPNGIFDLNVTANGNKTTFLLNGNQPFQATGTAGVGVGDINNDGVDDLMLTAPVGQQVYAVYGHPWLADDGSIKLADISSDNGFVIDGYDYILASSPFGYTLRLTLIYNTSDALESAQLRLTSPNGQLLWASNPGGGVTVTPQAYAVMQSDGNLVIYGQPGGNPGDVIWASNTNGSSGAVLKLAADGGLYITLNGQSIDTLYGGDQSLISSAITLEVNQQITTASSSFLINSTEGGNLFGNGNNVVMLGDINGDGFADVLSGGSSAGGVIIFGNSTKDLLDAALGTNDLLIYVDNAQVKEFVALGDFNGDGLADFGVVDSNQNFYLVLGENILGSLGNLSLGSSSIKISGFSQAWGMGDYNGDGYDDLILQSSSETTLVFGNAAGTLSTQQTLPGLGQLSSFTGVDVTGNGFQDIVVGQPASNPVPNSLIANGAIQIIPGQSLGIGTSTPINPPDASLSQPISSTWENLVTDQETAYGSSFAILNGWLYQAFLTTNTEAIGIIRSRNGVAWETVTQSSLSGLTVSGKIESFKGASSVSLAAYEGNLYVAVTDTSQNIWLGNSTQGSSNNLSFNFFQINQKTLDPDGFELAPTLITYDERLFVFFIKNDGSDPAVLYASSDNPGLQSSWTEQNPYAEGIPGIVSPVSVGAAVLGPTNTNPGTLAISFLANNKDNNGKNFVVTATGGGNGYNPVSGGTPWILDFSTQSPTAIPNINQNNPTSLTAVGNDLYLFYIVEDDNKPYYAYATATYNPTSNSLDSLQVNNSPFSGAIQSNPASVLFNQSLIVQGPQLTNGTNNGKFTYATSSPIYAPNNTLQFGRIVQNIGDFNGDGLADLAVLAPNFRTLVSANNNNAGTVNSGGVFIYYGTINGLSANSTPDLVLAAPNLNTEGTAFNLTQISSGGDVNGDGFDDLLISSPFSVISQSLDASSAGDQGVTWVVFGGTHWGNTNSITNSFDLGTLDNNQTNNSQNFNPYGFVTTGLPSSQAGISISGGADVNGDGFSDFMMGAPGGNDNLSYVFFGSDFTSQVNQTGTIGDDVMLGSPTGEIFVAGQGDDQIYTNGGVDAVYAGPGNDLVTVNDTNFRRLDGGSGTNFLKLTGYNGQDWNLTTLSPGLRLKNFNILDARGYGGNTLTLNALTITTLSANNEIQVLLDANDTLNLDSSFSFSNTVYLDNQNYYRYASKASAATVLVNLPNQVTFKAPNSNSPFLNLVPTAQANSSSTDNDASSLNDASFLAEATLVTTASADAPQPTRLFVSNPTIAEAAGVATFTIQRTGDLDKYVAVSYRTQDGSGKAGDRYLPVLGKILFKPGETSKNVTVDIPNDAITTGNKTFGLQVSLLAEADMAAALPFVFEAEASAGGAQIRGWSLEAKATNNGVLGGALQFEVTSLEGQAQVKLGLEGLPDFNNYYSYNAETQAYQELLFDGVTGARFEAGPVQAMYLTGQDGKRGDSDAVANGLVGINGYVGRTIPGLVSQDNRTFWAPTLADGQGQWRLIEAPPQNYELGWIAVDDSQGTIDGLLPSDPGYQTLALGRKQILFQNQDGAAAQALSQQIAQDSFVNADQLAPTEAQFFGELQSFNLAANRYYMLYFRQGETVTFSLNEPLQSLSDSRGYHQLRFGDITAEISSSTVFIPGPLHQTVAVTASLSRAAAYENSIALYPVDTLTGGLTLLGPDATDLITLYPDDPGYAQEALERARNPLTGVILNTPSNLATSQQRLELQGNTLYGIAIIPNATIEDVLSQNPSNDPNLGPVALFSFGAANPEGISHMSRLGSNLFGFEDLVGGGDLDYNDMILRLTPVL